MMSKLLSIFLVLSCLPVYAQSGMQSNVIKKNNLKLDFIDYPLSANISSQKIDVDEWMQMIESRSIKLEGLKHQQEILKRQVDIAELRKKCRSYGIDCPLISIREAIPKLIDSESVPQELFNPRIVGIFGKTALIKEQDHQRKYQEGDFYREYLIHSIDFDRIAFKSPSGEIMEVFVDAK